MSPDEFSDVLQTKPFVPERIHMTGGRFHELRHPELAIVGDEVVAIGVHENEGQRPRIRLLSLININELKPLSAAGGGSTNSDN